MLIQLGDYPWLDMDVERTSIIAKHCDNNLEWLHNFKALQKLKEATLHIKHGPHIALGHTTACFVFPRDTENRCIASDHKYSHQDLISCIARLE